jgi:hypothetical protein
VAAAENSTADPLIAQLADALESRGAIQSLKKMYWFKSGPTVVEEISLRKLTLHEEQTVANTIQREQARIELHDNSPVHEC